MSRTSPPNAEAVSRNFPDGVPLPRAVRALCDYLDVHGYPIVGGFEICNEGAEALESWFRGDPEMISKLGVFGNSATGSNYAVWLIEGDDPDAAPVVLLESEGRNATLARNAAEFCRLLGVGHDDVSLDDMTRPPEEVVEGLDDYRAWLQQTLGLTPPALGAEITDEAQAKSPDFAAWVDDWFRRRGI